jgi:hypothetical protein
VSDGSDRDHKIEIGVVQSGDGALTLPRLPVSPITEKLADSLRDLRFRTCYCSVRDQYFFGDLWTTKTQQVHQFAPPKHRLDFNEC